MTVTFITFLAGKGYASLLGLEIVYYFQITILEPQWKGKIIFGHFHDDFITNKILSLYL
jgi:hypothetical protein